MKIKNNMKAAFYLGFDKIIHPDASIEISDSKWDSFKNSPAIKSLLEDGRLSLIEEAPAVEEVVEKPKKSKKE